MRKLKLHPYRYLAKFYDQLQADAPERNRHARRKVLRNILPRVRSVCDLGCGTGSTAVELARLGLKVYAVDLSPTMCRLARQKARRAAAPVRVLCADMRSFRLPEPVDLVLCEFNPLNHLPRKNALPRALRAVARALRPGGHFFFDVNTRQTYQKLYPGCHVFETRNFCLVMRGGYDRQRQKGWLELDWFLPKGRLWRRSRERIEDVWWTDAEIRRALRATGFARIQSWDGVQVRPRMPGSRPGHDTYYLARKKPTPKKKQ